MKVVYQASNLIEAHIVAGMLNACDVPTHVGGHYLQGAVGDLAPTGICNVWVDEADLLRAQAIVDDYQASA